MNNLQASSVTSRRAFVRALSLGTGATLAGTSALATPLDWLAPGRKLGIALVGLGNYHRPTGPGLAANYVLPTGGHSHGFTGHGGAVTEAVQHPRQKLLWLQDLRPYNR